MSSAAGRPGAGGARGRQQGAVPEPLPWGAASACGNGSLLPAGWWELARSCSVASQGAPEGDSLSLCCVPRKGGASAARQTVTRGELAGPGVPVVFRRGPASGFGSIDTG